MGRLEGNLEDWQSTSKIPWLGQGIGKGGWAKSGLSQNCNFRVLVLKDWPWFHLRCTGNQAYWRRFITQFDRLTVTYLGLKYLRWRIWRETRELIGTGEQYTMSSSSSFIGHLLHLDNETPGGADARGSRSKSLKFRGKLRIEPRGYG